MAPTEGRVTRPERQWGCHRGTPKLGSGLACKHMHSSKSYSSLNGLITLTCDSTEMDEIRELLGVELVKIISSAIKMTD